MSFDETVTIKVSGSNEEINSAVTIMISNLLKTYSFTIKEEPLPLCQHKMNFFGARTKAKVLLA